MFLGHLVPEDLARGVCAGTDLNVTVAAELTKARARAAREQ